MGLQTEKLLTINGGSSSIKFAVYAMGEKPERSLVGKIERIGSDGTVFSTQTNKGEKNSQQISAVNFSEAAMFLTEWLGKQSFFKDVRCIGHRIVHGLKHTHAEIISDELLDDLQKISPYDPDHLPAEIEMVRMFKNKHADILQVACFDTAFHTTMPTVAKILPIPRRFYNAGVQRYGFHGLSYSYLMGTLAALDENAANGRVILAHLGSGASIAAVKDGKSIDTSMGFTPVGGLVMGTRTGDLDPGVAWYMMQSENLTPEKFSHIINHESGLLGVSETSSDMQDLLKAESTDMRAAEALNLFCYTVKKWIGSFTAALGGLDTLVFSGGIGENAAIIRARICEGMGYVGIILDEEQNNANAPIISTPASGVMVRVIPTDEELMIAKNIVAIYNEFLKGKPQS